MRFFGPRADKESIRQARLDVFYACRIPLGRVIFVHGQGPYAFDGFTGGARTVVETVIKSYLDQTMWSLTVCQD